MGKQRLETLHILKVITGKSDAWGKHPIIAMWQGHARALSEYGIAICNEWISRGYKDSRLPIIKTFRKGKLVYPSWIGNEDFHAAHRAALLYKNFEWYSQFNWQEKPELNYIWPKG
ncbi:MAG: hypothetical protein DWQ19_09185 [Crenarchaeota archaeon]|nr:MAG: hypothetical protein DWQ19_09185 [Thermoproteota archaeon]